MKAGTKKWVRAGDVKNLFPAAAPPSAVPPSRNPLEAAGKLLSRHDVLAEGQVVPEPGRCVQCGICSYNCPMSIDVRSHARRALPIHDSHCLTCSECVNRCPRGVLRFERISLFTVK
jgi:heterodisulfide reductase subunit C